MKHYLIFKDEKSNKFWHIQVSGTSFTVTYGKVGSNGTSQTKTFSNDEECLNEANKLLNEKLRKGYSKSEGEVKANPFIIKHSPALLKEKREKLTKATTLEDKKNLLSDYLSFLCESDECENNLKVLINSLVEVKIKGETLEVFIPWAYTENEKQIQYAKIEFRQAFQDKFDKSVPESFKRIYQLHNGISFSYVDDFVKDNPYANLNTSWAFFGVNSEGKLDDDGSWEYEAIEEGGNEEVIDYLEERGRGLEDIKCVGVYDEGQNWYLLHPMKKNKYKEPAIIQFDHGDCDMSSNAPFTKGLGGVILEELVKFIRR